MLAKTVSFYIGSHDEKELIQLRRYLFQELSQLPIQTEYMHQQSLELTQRYAKHRYIRLDYGNFNQIPWWQASKQRLNKILSQFPQWPKATINRSIQYLKRSIKRSIGIKRFFNRFSPRCLEPRIADYQQSYRHHLIIQVDPEQRIELENRLSDFFQGRIRNYFECSATEQYQAFRIAAAVAKCLIDYCESNTIDIQQRLVCLEVALSSNEAYWSFDLPMHLKENILFETCYGDFFYGQCHQDYLLKEHVDRQQFKMALLDDLTQRSIQLHIPIKVAATEHRL